jgi:hypothetical protein
MDTLMEYNMHTTMTWPLSELDMSQGLVIMLHRLSVIHSQIEFRI